MCASASTSSLTAANPSSSSEDSLILERSEFGVQPQATDDSRIISERPIVNVVFRIRKFSAREDKPWYGIEAQDIYAGSGVYALSAKRVEAPRLVRFEISGTVFDAKTQRELAKLFCVLHAPDLNMFTMLRPMQSIKLYEYALYEFLMATPSLQHVDLSISCVYKLGLRNYLWSDAARNLVSFRLKPSGSAKIADQLCRGLASHHHNLPNLQQLTLRNISDLTPQDLFFSLRVRRARGCNRPLLVEWRGCNIPSDIVSKARALHIYFKNI
ncbi:hypothetical protein EV714DRAFT_275471 [Schizophyllum commune]